MSEITIENIQLTLPVNAAYVSSARLTASSIANRMGFDIDEIEDIKAAVSEACTFIIKKIQQGVKDEFTLAFILNAKKLDITISTKAIVKLENTDEEMGLMMIRALMDEFLLSENAENNFEIKMVKTHKEVSFE